MKFIFIILLFCSVTKRMMGEMFNKHNLSLFDEFVSEDYIDHIGVEGREEYREMMKSAFSAFPDLNAVIDDIIAENDKVVVPFTFTGTHRGEFNGIAPTNKKISWTSIGILKYKDGKLYERWNVSDVLTLFLQLDAVSFNKNDQFQYYCR